MAVRPEEQTGPMGRKKSGKQAVKCAVYEEGFRALKILSAYTGEDMVECLTRAAIALAEKELPGAQAEYRLPGTPIEPEKKARKKGPE